MTYEDKDGDGTIFVAHDAEGNQPVRTGYILAHRDIRAGERVRLAGWLARYKDGGLVKDKHGNSILNLKMSDERLETPAESPTNPPDRDDEIPF